jgi:hypothetical protein
MISITELAAARSDLIDLVNNADDGPEVDEPRNKRIAAIERLIGHSEIRQDDISAVFDMLINADGVSGMDEGFEDKFRTKLLVRLRDFVVNAVPQQLAA